MLANIAKERFVMCEYHPSNVRIISPEYLHLMCTRREDAIIIFTASWGRYSNKLKKEIDKIPKENCKVPFYSIDVDKYEDFVNQYGVNGINTFPMMLIYQKGRLKDRLDINHWTDMMEFVQKLQKGE